MSFKISPQIHEQLWNLVETIPAITHKDLSFALAGGNPGIASALRLSLEQSGNHLAALGLKALFSSMSQTQYAKTTVRSSIATPKTNEQRGVTAKLPSEKSKRNGDAKVGASGIQKSSVSPKGLAFPCVKPVPRKMGRVLKHISDRLQTRGSSKSLHDECDICDVFKHKAPPRGLFKTKQFRAICIAHNSTLSSSLRTKKLKEAFSYVLDAPAKNAESKMDIGDSMPSSRSDIPSKLDSEASKATYADKVRAKRCSKAARKAEKASLVDMLDIQVQVLENKIRNEREKLASKSDVNVTTGEVTLPSVGSASLLGLQAKRRDLMTKKRQTLKTLLPSKKHKK